MGPIPIRNNYIEVELSWMYYALAIWDLLEVTIMILLEWWDVICLVATIMSQQVVLT